MPCNPCGAQAFDRFCNGTIFIGLAARGCDRGWRKMYPSHFLSPGKICRPNGSSAIHSGRFNDRNDSPRPCAPSPVRFLSAAIFVCKPSTSRGNPCALGCAVRGLLPMKPSPRWSRKSSRSNAGSGTISIIPITLFRCCHWNRLRKAQPILVRA